jgi:nitroreductase
LYQAIFRRRSVRKFMPEPLDQGTLEQLTEFTSSMRPLFPGVRTEIRVLSREDSRGAFRVDAPHYLAAFSENAEVKEANTGFLLQQADLFLSSSGLGSCWQGGPRPIKEIRRTSELEYVIMVAFGRPAEPVHRNSSGEFKRKPLNDISEVRGHSDIMEAARLSPSGMNNQSWRFSGDDGGIHAYAGRSMITDRMNRINVGIALCHMWLAAEHAGRKVDFTRDVMAADDAPKSHTYIATMKFAE